KARLPHDRLDRHPLRQVQPADLRPVLHCDHPLPDTGHGGVNIHPPAEGQFSAAVDNPQGKRTAFWNTTAGVITAIAALIASLVAAATSIAQVASPGNDAGGGSDPRATPSTRSPTVSATSATAIPAKILQPTDSKLVDNCIPVKGPAPPLQGERTYWL